MICKYCGRPVEQSIEGELVCSNDEQTTQDMSQDEKDQYELVKWLEWHCEGCEEVTSRAILKRNHGYCNDCNLEHEAFIDILLEQ